MHIALYQPEIAQNTGTIIRLAQCFDLTIDLIHPLGFVFSSKHLKRSGMDYIEKAKINHHEDFDSFLKQYPDKRIILSDTKGSKSLWNFSFEKKDIILFGRESTGVPHAVFSKIDHAIKIPIQDRSLNLALSCAIVTGEYMRQLQ